jgi:hypothetical protein
VPWSEAGASRLLLTTRRPDLPHPQYPATGSHAHRLRRLAGLAPDDAAAYAQRLLDLHEVPRHHHPDPEALQRLLEPVRYPPCP